MKNAFRIRKNKGQQLLSVLLLLFYMSYSVGATMFVHLHLRNGIIVRHAHPFDTKNTAGTSPFQSHSHTDNEYLYLGQLSNATSDEPESGLTAEKVTFPLLVVLLLNTREYRDEFCHFQSVTLRSPPFILS